MGADLDGIPWGRPHWLVFASTSAGFLLWGLITSLGYIIYPEFHDPAYIALVAAMPLLGDVVLSRLSDVFVGRKRAFIATMSLYAAGSIIVALDVLYASMNIALFLVGYALATFAVEGEVPVSLAFIAEVAPSTRRERALILATNFDNVGAALAAAIAFLAYGSTSSYSAEALSIVGAALAALAAVAVIRSMIPESVRWLRAKGRAADAAAEESRMGVPRSASPAKSVEPTVGFLGRYSFLAALGISQYLTYGLMAFVVADYFFSGESLNLVVLVANAAAALAGAAASLVAERIGSVRFALLSYGGGLIAMAPIVAWALYFPVTWAFYPLLALNMAFSEFAWATRIVYEPALFPTERRAFMVGLVRVVPIAAYSASAYLTSSMSEAAFLAYNAALWALGAAASTAWRFLGYDVSMAPLELTGSPPSRPGLALDEPHDASHEREDRSYHESPEDRERDYRIYQEQRIAGPGPSRILRLGYREPDAPHREHRDREHEPYREEQELNGPHRRQKYHQREVRQPQQERQHAESESYRAHVESEPLRQGAFVSYLILLMLSRAAPRYAVRQPRRQGPGPRREERVRNSGQERPRGDPGRPGPR